MDKTYSQSEVLEKLEARCGKFPSLRQAAIAGRIDYETLLKILRKERGVNPAAARWVGFERVPEMRFKRLPAEQRFARVEEK